MVIAIFFCHVGDDLVPAVVLEVQIYIGHLFTLDVEEALEDQPVAHRVDVGDAQAVEHQASSRATSDPEKNMLAPGEAGDVSHHQEVVGELGLLYYVQLIGEAALHLFTGVLDAPSQALYAQRLEVIVSVLSIWSLVEGQP